MFENFINCKNCKHKISSVAIICPKCDKRVAPFKICPLCKKDNEIKFKNCIDCGHPFNDKFYWLLGLLGVFCFLMTITFPSFFIGTIFFSIFYILLSAIRHNENTRGTIEILYSGFGAIIILALFILCIGYARNNLGPVNGTLLSILVPLAVYFGFLILWKAGRRVLHKVVP